jgi:hypothetical protein
MPLDLDGLKQKQARRSSSGWSPKEAENLIRILPYTSKYFTTQLADFAYEFRSHFMKADGMETRVFRCAKDKGEQCIFCEIVAKNKETQDPAIKKAIDQIRRSERHLMNIIDLNKIADGIQTYECGPKVYDDLLGFMSNPAWGDLVHPQQGRNISLILTPQGKSRSGYNEYSVQPHPNVIDITPHLPSDWLEKIDALEAQVAKYATQAEAEKWLEALRLWGDAKAPVANVGGPPPPASAPLPFTPPPAPATAAPPAPTPAPAAMSFTPSAPTLATAAPAPVMQAAATVTENVSPELAAFSNQQGLVLAEKNVGSGKRKPVPVCFSEGPNNKEIGFNPAKYPCEKGCPVRPNCQLITLGLESL